MVSVVGCRDQLSPQETVTPPFLIVFLHLSSKPQADSAYPESEAGVYINQGVYFGVHGA